MRRLVRALVRWWRPPVDLRILRLERELSQRTRDLIDVEQDLEAARARIRVLEEAARRRNGILR